MSFIATTKSLYRTWAYIAYCFARKTKKSGNKISIKMHARDDHNVHDLVVIYFNKHGLSLIFAVAGFSKSITTLQQYYAPIQK